MDAEKHPRIITPMPPDLVAAIDDYKFAKRLDSRAEAIRRLIQLGLEAASGDDAQTSYDPGPARQKEKA